MLILGIGFDLQDKICGLDFGLDIGFDLED